MDADFRRLRRSPPRPIRRIAINSPSVSRPGCRPSPSPAELRARRFSCPVSRSRLRRRVRAGCVSVDPVGILQTKFARDLAGADFSRMRADECDNGVPAPENPVALLRHCTCGPCPRVSSRAFFLERAGVALAGEVLVADVTGARALLAASDFGFAVVFFAVAFLTGFSAFSNTTLRGAVVLGSSWRHAWACRHLSPRARQSARWLPARVMVSGVLSLGIVALTPPAVT